VSFQAPVIWMSISSRAAESPLQASSTAATSLPNAFWRSFSTSTVPMTFLFCIENRYDNFRSRAPKRRQIMRIGGNSSSCRAHLDDKFQRISVKPCTRHPFLLGSRRPTAWAEFFRILPETSAICTRSAFQLSQLRQPAASACASTRKNLEPAEAHWFSLHCDCGWTGAVMGMNAVNHWVDPWGKRPGTQQLRAIERH
jgi:hypothetical protein